MKLIDTKYFKVLDIAKPLLDNVKYILNNIEKNFIHLQCLLLQLKNLYLRKKYLNQFLQMNKNLNLFKEV